MINIVASLLSSGYYIYYFNKECVTGTKKQTLFTSESPTDVAICQNEKTPTVCFNVETKTNYEKIMSFAYKVFGSNTHKSWKDSNNLISGWVEPILTPDMKSAKPSKIFHKYQSDNWESNDKASWLISSKNNIGIALISPLEDDMRIWKTYIREGEAIWIPKGWFMKISVEDLAIMI